MLFKPEWVADVLGGRKRQTLRVRKPRVSVGRTYAVQTSYYSKAVGRIRVTDVRQTTLAEMTDADVVAEGWRSGERDQFERYFAEVNHFEPDTLDADGWAELRRRPFWLIDFEPAPDATPSRARRAS